MTPGRGNPSGSLMTHQASTQEHFHELLGPDSINLLLKIPQKHNRPKPPKTSQTLILHVLSFKLKPVQPAPPQDFGLSSWKLSPSSLV